MEWGARNEAASAGTLLAHSNVTIVVFGEDNAPPLLGVYTLEGLALAVDPLLTTSGSRQLYHVLATQPCLAAQEWV